MKRKRNSSVDVDAKKSLFEMQCADFCSERIASVDLTKRGCTLAAQIAELLATSKYKKKLHCQQPAFDNAVFPFKTDFLKFAETEVAEFQWLPPKTSSVIILHPPWIAPNGTYEVDLHLTLPLKMFGSKDYINLIYEVKRALYLCVCAALISKSRESYRISWSSTFHGELYPLLLVEDGDITVRIHATAPLDGFIKEHRFRPDIGNVRPSLFRNGDKSLDKSPSPYFSQRLLSHLKFPALQSNAFDVASEAPAIGRALILVQAWHSSRSTQVHPLLPHLLLLSLLNKNTISEVNDVEAILRAYFVTLANLSLTEPFDIKEQSSERNIKLLHDVFDVTIVEEGLFNIGYSLTKQQLKKLKAEALRSLDLFSVANFDSLFLRKDRFEDVFDYYYNIRLPESVFCVEDYIIDTATRTDQIWKFARSVLRQCEGAMPERFEYSDAYSTFFEEQKWPVNALRPASSLPFVCIGFKATADWGNPLTFGPNADLPEAAQFREFWCGKSELRRFGDNTIKEAVVWGEASNDTIPTQILGFLFEKKLSISKLHMLACCELSLDFLPHKLAQTAMNRAFAKLNGFLRGLKNMPLSVSTVTSTSAYLRGTEPFETAALFSDELSQVDSKLQVQIPTPSHRCPKFTPSLEVFIRLEYAHNWGNEVEVIRRLIIAFYVHLSEQLKAQYNIVCHPTPAGLYVQIDGKAFRIIIVNEKVLAILRSKVESMQLAGVPNAVKSSEAQRLAILTKAHKTEPAIKQQLAAIALKHTHFGASCRLFKLWLARRMLSGHLHEIACEMLVAAAFEQGGVQLAPNSAIAGLRATLRLLTQHNWIMQPLIIDLDGKWDEQQRAEVEASFISMRPVLPPIVLATQEDKNGNAWTSSSPCAIMAKRIIALARTSLTLIDSVLSTQQHANLTALFEPQYIKFDARIEIADEAYHTDRKRVKADKKSLRHLPVLDFNPVELLVERLNNDFNTIAFFMYDQYSASEIGVKWKDPVLEIDSKIGRCANYTLKYDNTDKMIVNKEEVLETVAILGRGIISNIYVGEKVFWSSATFCDNVVDEDEEKIIVPKKKKKTFDNDADWNTVPVAKLEVKNTNKTSVDLPRKAQKKNYDKAPSKKNNESIAKKGSSVHITVNGRKSALEITSNEDDEHCHLYTMPPKQASTAPDKKDKARNRPLFDI